MRRRREWSVADCDATEIRRGSSTKSDGATQQEWQQHIKENHFLT